MHTSSSAPSPRLFADRLGERMEGIGMGLLIAYFVIEGSKQPSVWIVYAAVGLMLLGAWVPVIFSRRRRSTSGEPSAGSAPDA